MIPAAPRASRPRASTRRRLACVAAIAAGFALAGCRGKPHNYLNENDRLRAENVDLREKIDKLTQALERREAELRQLRQAGATTRPGSTAGPGAEVALPRVVALQFDKHSGAIPTHNPGPDDVLRLYLLTLDQQGRFLPVAAGVAVQVVAIRPGQAPLVLGDLSVNPAGFDKTYRSGLTGTHYTLEVPLAKFPEGVASATARLTLTDAATGATLTCEKAFPLKPGP